MKRLDLKVLAALACALISNVCGLSYLNEAATLQQPLLGGKTARNVAIIGMT